MGSERCDDDIQTIICRASPTNCALFGELPTF